MRGVGALTYKWAAGNVDEARLMDLRHRSNSRSNPLSVADQATLQMLENAAREHNRDLEMRYAFGDDYGTPRTVIEARHRFDRPATTTAATMPQAQPIRLMTPAECAAQPGRKYVIKGLLSEGDIACIFGPPGAGKSILAPHFAYGVAQGRAVFGRRCKKGITFYIAAEDAHGMRQRVRALKVVQGDAPGFMLVEGVSNLLDPTQVAVLRALVAKHRPKLIILDTIALGFPGLQENESQAMGQVVAQARSLAEHGAAVVLIHHDTKAQDGTPRGHSLLNGALDVSLHVARADDAKIVRGKLVKNRNGTCDLAIAFRINAVSVGTDEDGDSVTAPTAEELIGESAGMATKLPGAASAAMRILRDLMADGRRDVAEGDWRDACEDKRISTSDDAKSRGKTFRRAYAELLERNLIVAGAGRVSLTVAAGSGDRGTFGDILEMSPQQKGGQRGQGYKTLVPVPHALDEKNG